MVTIKNTLLISLELKLCVRKLLTQLKVVRVFPPHFFQTDKSLFLAMDNTLKSDKCGIFSYINKKDIPSTREKTSLEYNIALCTAQTL